MPLYTAINVEIFLSQCTSWLRTLNFFLKSFLQAVVSIAAFFFIRYVPGLRFHVYGGIGHRDLNRDLNRDLYSVSFY